MWRARCALSVIATALALTTACSSALGPTDDDGGSDEGDTGRPDGAVTPDGGTEVDAGNDPEGPRILRMTVNNDSLERGPMPGELDSLIVTAVVTDPQGVANLLGGELLDPTTGNTYGAFGTTTTPGTYQIDLMWTGIDRVRPIDASAGGSARVFEANFFDQEGHLSRASVSVVLRCTLDELGLCDGECTDLRSDPAHCGECRNDVSPRLCVDGAASCGDSTYCPTAGRCVDLQSDDGHCGACDMPVAEGQYCARGAARCARSGDLACSYMGGDFCIRESVMDCGRCSRQCNAVPTAEPSCVESRCRYSITVSRDDAERTGDEICRARGLECLSVDGFSGSSPCGVVVPGSGFVYVLCTE